MAIKKKKEENVSSECFKKKSAFPRWKHKFLLRYYWFQYWNQYKAEIDKSNILQITKFSYLKKILEPSVRSLVDKLPFTSEGYKQFKGKLKAKYGKTSEIVNSYVQQIISMFTINSSSLSCIHLFFEKLFTHIQALETIGKITDINGYAWMLDRLPVFDLILPVTTILGKSGTIYS